MKEEATFKLLVKFERIREISKGKLKKRDKVN